MDPLFSITLDAEWRLTAVAETWLLVASLIVILVIVLVIHWLVSNGFSFASDLEIDEAELGIGDQKIKLKRDVTDRQIAYKLWVELSTRKIGLEIDLDHDVIVELYNSWYEFFGVARELIKEIPASKLKRRHTRDIANLAIKVLNTGVRPHLTRWQARFRRWYEQNARENPNQTPQEIQQRFPDYDELVADMKKVNGQLIMYRNKLHDLVMG